MIAFRIVVIAVAAYISSGWVRSQRAGSSGK
jgi:hypothetical protein